MIPSLYSINKKLREHGVSEEKLKEISKAFTEAHDRIAYNAGFG